MEGSTPQPLYFGGPLGLNFQIPLSGLVQLGLNGVGGLFRAYRSAGAWGAGLPFTLLCLSAPHESLFRYGGFAYNSR